MTDVEKIAKFKSRRDELQGIVDANAARLADPAFRASSRIEKIEEELAWLAVEIPRLEALPDDAG